MTLAVPSRLRVSKCAFNPSSQSASGGQSITGFEQVVVNPSGRWVAALTFDVLGEEEVLLFRALQGQLMGRANPVLVAPRDGIRPHDNSGKPFEWRTAVPFAGGALFFGDEGFPIPLANAAYAYAAAAQYATSLQVAVQIGSGLRPGHYFGAVDRLYRVLTMTQATSVSAQVVTFWPPLRAPIAQNDPIILDQPSCKMRLAKDDSGSLDLAWRQPASPTMEFVEAS